MKFTLLSGMGLLASLLVGCNDSSADSLTVTQAQNGAAAVLAKGETLSVVLAGNPTTGYQWTVVENDADRLQPLEPFYEADSNAIGSGGVYTFRFKALQAGTSLLRMAYGRAWESAPVQTYSLTVTVRENGNDDASVSLDDTKWKLAAWSASSLNPADFNITADFAGGQIAGRSAINSYSGPCSASADGSFSIGAIAMTEMAGEPAAMQAESLYHSLLAQSRRWRIADAQLTLANAPDQPLLIFDAAE